MKRRFILAIMLILSFTFLLNAQTTKCASGNCQNGFGTLKYVGGDVGIDASFDGAKDKYVGNFVNGKREGKGTTFYIRPATPAPHRRSVRIEGEYKNNAIVTGVGYDVSNNVVAVFKNGIDILQVKLPCTVEKLNERCEFKYPSAEKYISDCNVYMIRNPNNNLYWKGEIFYDSNNKMYRDRQIISNWNQFDGCHDSRVERPTKTKEDIIKGCVLSLCGENYEFK